MSMGIKNEAVITATNKQSGSKKTRKANYKQSRNWCFTDFELMNWSAIYEENKGIIRYLCVGEEICPSTNKKHFQGWIQFHKKKTMGGVKNIINSTKTHLESCRGSEFDNEKYCKKDGKYKTFGEDFKIQGSNTNYVDREVELRELMQEIDGGVSDYELIRNDPDRYDRSKKFIADYRRLKTEEDNKAYLQENFGEIKYNAIQRLIMKHLEKQTERQITWVYDPMGGVGKTYLSKHLMAKFGAARFTNGRTKDIAYAYNGESVVVIDLSRSLEERVNYDIIEQLKNGLLFNSKYESGTKVFKTPKIVIMANFHPMLSKLSADRWDVIDLTYPDRVEFIEEPVEEVDEKEGVCDKVVFDDVEANTVSKVVDVVKTHKTVLKPKLVVSIMAPRAYSDVIRSGD